MITTSKGTMIKLISKITPKIATLEIIIRNALDNELSKQDNNWIQNSNDERMIKAREKNREKYREKYKKQKPIPSSISISH